MMAIRGIGRAWRGQENEGCAGRCQGWGAAGRKAAPPWGKLVMTAVVVVLLVVIAADDVDETEHPVVHLMRPVHADDEIAPGLEELVGDQLAVRDQDIARRVFLTGGNRPAVEELPPAHRDHAAGGEQAI